MKQNVLFLENFSDLLSQGYTVEQSLTLSHQIFHLPFYNHYINELEKGEDIYNLLINDDFPDVFKHYLSFYRNKSTLSEAIIKSLNIYTMQTQFIEKLKKQLTYPLLLIVFMFFFSLFILLFLLPQVYILFDSFSIEVNIFTTLMILFLRIFPYMFIIIVLSFSVFIILLLYGIIKKNYKIIDGYMNVPFIKDILKKYFSLKFALFYNELSLESIDTASIITLLNEYVHDDLKIIVYEMRRLMKDGDHIEDILTKLKYFDPLLISIFKIQIYNSYKKDMMSYYIETTYKLIDLYINRFIKFFIPVIYCFVSFFVVSIYVAIIMPLMSGFSYI